VPRGLPEPPVARSKTLVQVIGDQGAGKTTHVQHWRRSAPGPYHYIPRRPYRGRWLTGPVGELVYGDEIDRMPRVLRRWWFRQLARVEATVVIGTHKDLTRLGKRFGFTVRTHELPALDEETLGTIINRRLQTHALDTRPVLVSFDSADIKRIFDKSDGSLRVAEVLCHELLAERVLYSSSAAGQQ